MHKLSELVRDFIKANKLITGNEKNILVGLSGGADSVCLLFMLKAFKASGLFPEACLLAAHVNHGIRGDEALRDESFVKRLCEENGIKLFTKRFDVPGIAKENAESEEAAGRRLRYLFFREVLKRQGGGVIATAHHKNDLAETVLMNIARGTGLTGLAGIRAKQGDVVRPLICLTREQIEEYNAAKGLDFVNDSTNDCDIYTRNFLRNRVIPLLEENVNDRVVEHIYRLSEIAIGADEYFRAEADRLFCKCEITAEGIVIPYMFDSAPIEGIIREYLYRRVFCELSGTSMDLSSERVRSIDALCLSGVRGERIGKVIELSHDVNVMALYGGLLFFHRTLMCDMHKSVRVDAGCVCHSKEEQGEALFSRNSMENNRLNLFEGDIRDRLEAGEEVRLTSGDVTFTMQLTENFVKNDNSDYTKYFDYDKINDTACLRYAGSDDYITVTADGKKHSLKKELKDRKIAADERKRVLVLAQGNECLWALGIRRGMSALADEDCRIIKITVI